MIFMLENHKFPPDEFLDILFGAGLLLKVETKRVRTNRLLIDVVKRCQVCEKVPHQLQKKKKQLSLPKICTKKIKFRT